MRKEVKFLQGNEACVEGAISAGVRFFAGYPITPSTEITELLALRLPQVGGKFIQMEDEISSIAAVIGASLAGGKSMTATSGPGFSLMQEALGYACIAEIPCLIVEVQRGGPSTGSPTGPSQSDVMQSRWGTHGDHSIIVLSPFSVQEMYSLTIKAINLSESYRTPVILLSDEVVSHTREKIIIPDHIELVERKKASQEGTYYPYLVEDDEDIPPFVSFGEGQFFHVTGLLHDFDGFPSAKVKVVDKLIRRLVDKIEKHREEITFVHQEFIEDAEIIVFAYGCTGRSALKAVKDARSRGIKVGYFRPITLWPFPENQLREATRGVSKVIVAEMNMGQMLGEVQKVVCGHADIVPILKVSGEMITPAEITARIMEN